MSVIYGVDGNIMFEDDNLSIRELVILNRNSLRCAYLEGANLSDAYLVKANLKGANLVDTVIVGTNFTDADLSETVLDGIDLSDIVKEDEDCNVDELKTAIKATKAKLEVYVSLSL